MRSRDAAGVVVTQALFGVAVLAVVNALRHDWPLVSVGAIIAVGTGSLSRPCSALGRHTARGGKTKEIRCPP